MMENKQIETENNGQDASVQQPPQQVTTVTVKQQDGCMGCLKWIIIAIIIIIVIIGIMLVAGVGLVADTIDKMPK